MTHDLERDEAIAEFLLLIEQCGMSTDNPQDGWNLAFALFMKGRTVKKPSGRKTTTKILVRDAVTMFGVEDAKRHGDTRGEKEILHEVAKANDWVVSANTLWRRYQYLKKSASPQRQRLVKALRDQIR